MSLKENSSYQKALTDLSAWDNPPEGLVFPSEENTASKVQKLLKQNNFIIALLVQQSEKISKLEQQLQAPAPKEVNTDLDELVTKLSNLSLKDKQVPARKDSPFYVIKDPKLIWKEEKAKLDGAKR